MMTTDKTGTSINMDIFRGILFLESTTATIMSNSNKIPHDHQLDSEIFIFMFSFSIIHVASTAVAESRIDCLTTAFQLQCHALFEDCHIVEARFLAADFSAGRHVDHIVEQLLPHCV